MGNLQRYRAADLPALMERINKNSIGLDTVFDDFFNLTHTESYPPYNLIHVKLNVVGEKLDKEEDKDKFLHRGLAQRSFERAWTISDDTEIKEVQFEDGLLTIKLGKVVPEHHTRKDWL